MIPLYVENTYARGSAGNPQKNPIYFIRKRIGKLPSTEYDIIVLNADDTKTQESDFLGDTDLTYIDPVLIPPGISVPYTQPIRIQYDVEEAEVEWIYDSVIEPYHLRDGSISTQPRATHALLTIKGFVRGNSFKDLQKAVSYLNYSFDPTINYLEGASTWDNTVTPNWQPFENAGFGVLAWFNRSTPPGWSQSTWNYASVDPFSYQPYSRLNRFMFTRSIDKPVTIDTKFSDMNAPFTIRLLAVDPAQYEFISPSTFLGSGEVEPGFVHKSRNGETIKSLGWSGAGKVSDETFIMSTYPWRMGPGWREVTEDTPTP